MNNEIWKDIPWWEWMYQVSNIGRIKSLERKVRTKWNNIFRTIKEKILKPKIDKDWYHRTQLYIKQKCKNYYIHRLILETFIWPSDWLFCNHKNWIKDDNRLENLEWVTQSENELHKIHVLWSKTHFMLNPQTKKVWQYTKDNIFIKEWNSQIEASKALNINDSGISWCCVWRLKTTWGFIFKHL